MFPDIHKQKEGFTFSEAFLCFYPGKRIGKSIPSIIWDYLLFRQHNPNRKHNLPPNLALMAPRSA
jgi:hypothetical protein